MGGSCIHIRVATGLALVLAAAVATTACEESPVDKQQPVYSCAPDEGNQLYEQRIAPLLATDRPKSCNNCHLAGIDLSLFQRATPCQTMACLHERELVDFDNPEASTILTWIDRATPGDGITQAVINEEYEGFLAWIEQSATCGTCPTFDNPCDEAEDAGEPCTGDEVFVDPGDCSEHTREALFQDRVYRWRDRCYPCHFDNKDNDGPNWIVTGSCNLASLKTMHNIRNAGYIDWQNPAKSLLLQKPLAQSAGGIEHGGHDKFSSTEDQAYRDFLSWIEREVSCTP